MILSSFTRGTAFTVRLLSVGILLGLVACGGGGSNSTPTPTPTPIPADTTPNDFTINDVSGVMPGELAVSSAITITGINTPAPVSVEGGEYAIEEEAFTAEPGTIANGEQVRVRMTAPAEFSTTDNASLTVGGVTRAFNVTTQDADTTPETFSFNTVNDAELATEYTQSILVEGINTSVLVTIDNGEYAIDEGAYTSADGSAVAGQSITVKLTSAATFDTPLSATLAVGSEQGTLTVKTQPRDIVPGQYSFTDQSDVSPSSDVISAPVTITDINDAAPISVTGGSYSIDGGEFTTAAGTVTNGQAVRVATTSSGDSGGSVNVRLDVGEVNDVFTVTTETDTKPPVVELHFPTPLSLTTDATMVVRGAASDDFGEITSLSINGIDATATSDNFATWEAEIALALDTRNEINAVATDGNGNETAAGSSLIGRIERRADINGAFPDEAAKSGYNVVLLPDDPMSVLVGTGILLSKFNLWTGEWTDYISDSSFPSGSFSAFNYISLNDKSEPHSLIVSSTSRGDIAVFDLEMTDFVRLVDYPINNVVGPAVVDEAGENFYFADGTSLEIKKINIASGEQTIISSNTFPDTNNPFSSNLYGMVIDENYEIAYVTGGLPINNDWAIWRVDLNTGAREIVSDSSVPDASNVPEGTLDYHGQFASLVWDKKRNRLILGMPTGDTSLIAINLDSNAGALGARTPFLDATPNVGSVADFLTGISIDEGKDIAYVSTVLYGFTSNWWGHVSAVDLPTGNQVIISKDEYIIE